MPRIRQIIAIDVALQTVYLIQCVFVLCHCGSLSTPIKRKYQPPDGPTIAASTRTCLIEEKGRVQCWEADREGKFTAVIIKNLPPIRAIFAQYNPSWFNSDRESSCGIDESGGVWCWGADPKAIRRLNKSPKRWQTKMPTALKGWPRLNQLAIGEDFMCGLTDRGKVLCEGYYGSISFYGDWSQIAKPKPVDIDGRGGIEKIVAGPEHICALRKTDGEVWCWGNNKYGQTGQPIAEQCKKDGDDSCLTKTPTKVGTLVDVQDISAGSEHTCAVKGDGSVWCWGSRDGMGTHLADGGRFERCKTIDRCSSVPRRISGLSQIRSVASSELYNVALDQRGGIWCWGICDLNDEVKKPHRIPFSKHVSRIAAGPAHTCVLDQEGKPFCFGTGRFYGIGNGAVSEEPIPLVGAESLKLSRIIKYTKGAHHGCVLDDRGLGGETTKVNLEYVECLYTNRQRQFMQSALLPMLLPQPIFLA